MRVAAIDIGTNSVLLTVAEGTGSGPIPVVEQATITRIGRGVERTRALAPDRVEATLECLRTYADLITRNDVSKLAVVGTSALRDAGGGVEFCDRAERVLGVRPRVITGIEEARLTFAGALSGLPAPGSDVVVVDIGGGSTEIIVGAPGGKVPASMVSLDVGSVRLTERHVAGDPPTASELEAVRCDVELALRRVAPPPLHSTVIGVAGTVTTFVALEQALISYDSSRVHGQKLSLETLERLISELAGLPLVERCQLAGLEPARADVIIAGGCVLSEIARWLSARELVVSDRGVRWGLVRELLDDS